MSAAVLFHPSAYILKLGRRSVDGDVLRNRKGLSGKEHEQREKATTGVSERGSAHRVLLEKKSACAGSYGRGDMGVRDRRTAVLGPGLLSPTGGSEHGPHCVQLGFPKRSFDVVSH